ncbi:hypothetical protein [Acinetobacter sp. ASP199]|uniref:hypothetical protein n=1 Tax=unclassified Acinetobacter TaxID=196816 RepID=UPI001F620AB6|nr:hypothetical protein [Acinetobacter sp. ASP199]UNT58307.1 hypothetical protein IHE35_09195 [Acinetobacter sp. ASP199]
MKSYVIPVCALLVGVMGYYVYKQSENRRQQEINRIITDANNSLQAIEAKHTRH